jgi:hypothetical protein
MDLSSLPVIIGSARKGAALFRGDAFSEEACTARMERGLVV